MTERMVKLSQFANQVEAEHVASLLAERGVPAYAEGATSNTTLSHVGVALGGVKLLVAESDLEHGQKVLAEIEPEFGQDWYCGVCEETLAASFHMCWSCGGARSDVETELPEPSATPLRPEYSESQSESQRDASNPYVASHVDLTGGSLAGDETSKIQLAENRVTRAYRAALVSTFLCPILLNIASFYLLLRVQMAETKLSARFNRLWYWAFAINLASISLWVSLFLLLRVYPLLVF